MKNNPIARFGIFLLFLLPFALPIIITGEPLSAALGFVVLAIAFGIYKLYTKTPQYKAKKQANDEDKNLIDSLVQFKENEHVLILNGRSEKLVKVLSLEDSSDATQKYVPKTLHYGSVSVGGVTTGGFYTTGGNSYFSTKKNGLCNLTYYPGTGVNTLHVSKIQLSDELFAEALKSNIAEYIDKDSRQILVNDPPKMSVEETRAFLDRVNKGIYKGSDLGLPSWEKGQKIYNWILNVSE